jgi:NinB protein
MSRTFYLVHAEARRGALQCVTEAPDGYVVSVKPPKRNGEQNARLHARIDEIARSREWAGKRWDAETWKRLLVAAWDRASGRQVLFVPALDGQGVDVVFRRTSTLTVSECADLMTFIDAWDAMQ